MPSFRSSGKVKCDSACKHFINSQGYPGVRQICFKMVNMLHMHLILGLYECKDSIQRWYCGGAAHSFQWHSLSLGLPGVHRPTRKGCLWVQLNPQRMKSQRHNSGRQESTICGREREREQKEPGSGDSCADLCHTTAHAQKMTKWPKPLWASFLYWYMGSKNLYWRLTSKLIWVMFLNSWNNIVAHNKLWLIRPGRSFWGFQSSHQRPFCTVAPSGP